MNFLSVYSIRARLFAAVIAVAPLLALIASTMSLAPLGLHQVIISLAISVLLFVATDLARRFGQRIEPAIELSMGGRPSIFMLRHTDRTIPVDLKARLLDFLGSKIGRKPPSPEQEADAPALADAFYDECARWLIEKTRDRKRFEILFEENVTYGFRRNIYGLKIFALVLNISVIVSVVCIIYFWNASHFELNSPYFTILFVTILHALYLFFACTRRSVCTASKKYAERLILSGSILIDDPRKKKQ